MRVIVDDVSASYLFVDTPELDVMRSAARTGFGACSRRTFVIRSRQTDRVRRRSIILPSTSPITWSVLEFEPVGVTDPVRERY
jgi:hypothetical protein